MIASLPSPLESAPGVTDVIGLLFLIACVVIGTAAIILPIVVILIHSRVNRIAKTLEHMASMMRNGK